MSSTNTSNTGSSTQAGKDAASGVEDAFAKVHGVGESIRGNINAAVDGLSHDSAAQAKNDAIAQKGEQEFDSGKLAHKKRDL